MSGKSTKHSSTQGNDNVPKFRGIYGLMELLSGSRTDSLTDAEYDDILSGVNPATILYLINGLKTGKINSDQLLIKGIDNVRSEEGLLPIALALREGANPNLYVKYSEQNKTIHILGYCYQTLSPVMARRNMTTIINSIAIMLKTMGTKHILHIFDDKNEIETTEKSLSVGQWLDQQQYPSIHKSIESNFELVEPAFMTKIGSLLDKPSLIDLSRISIRELVQDHSTNVLSVNSSAIAGYIYT